MRPDSTQVEIFSLILLGYLFWMRRESRRRLSWLARIQKEGKRVQATITGTDNLTLDLVRKIPCEFRDDKRELRQGKIFLDIRGCNLHGLVKGKIVTVLYLDDNPSETVLEDAVEGLQRIWRMRAQHFFIVMVIAVVAMLIIVNVIKIYG